MVSGDGLVHEVYQGLMSRPDWQTAVKIAVGESSVILLHPALPSVGVSIWMNRGCQQNDSLADG